MIDKEKVENAVEMLLQGIGEDTNREGVKETPQRIARMFQEIFAGMDEEPSKHLSKVFQVENNEMVMERDITFHSMCEHHLMPFFGKVHIAYIPNGKVVGISKLARTVEVFARRLQIQEKMTAQIAHAIMNELNPKGVMVMVEAEHLCMSMRGIKKPGTNTVTVVKLGEFEENIEKVEDFYRMLR